MQTAKDPSDCDVTADTRGNCSGDPNRPPNTIPPTAATNSINIAAAPAAVSRIRELILRILSLSPSIPLLTPSASTAKVFTSCQRPASPLVLAPQLAPLQEQVLLVLLWLVPAWLVLVPVPAWLRVQALG